MEELKQLVRENYKDSEFNDAFQFTKKQLIRRLLEADKKYWRTDGKLGGNNTDDYFYHQALIVIQSYEWYKLVTINYEKMKKFISQKTSPNEREEVFLYVFEKIIDNEYRALRINSKQTSKKILFKQVKNKIGEFFHKKCNTPTWIRNHSNFLYWSVFKLLCCRKIDKYEVINILMQEGRKVSALENVITEIIIKHKDCGASDKPVKEGESKPPDDTTIFLQRLHDIFLNEKYEENPEDAVNIKKLKKDIKKLRINPKQKNMLRLYFCEEYTYREIAEKMGMRINQVSGQIAYIRRRLKRVLKKYLDKEIISQFEAKFTSNKDRKTK